MIDEVRELLDLYARWLRERMALREVGEWVEVTTPYLDRHNDHLQFYVHRENGHYLLSDDGYVIDDLRLSGCAIDTPKRTELLNLTLSGFGVTRRGDAIVVPASPDNFGQRKHNLVQAMLAVNDLFYLAEPTVTSVFLEDVAGWMEASGVRYTERAKFTGHSGYDHTFDFVVPRSPRQPERLVRAINRPSKETAEAAAFSWLDIKDNRPPGAKMYAFLNDVVREPAVAVVEALRAYQVIPVPWTHREDVRDELVA